MGPLSVLNSKGDQAFGIPNQCEAQLWIAGQVATGQSAKERKTQSHIPVTGTLPRILKPRFPSVFRHMSDVRHSPSNANALYLLGMCALELGKPQEAVSLMTKSLPHSRTRR